jgi:NADPH:quinone reductase-like Zn-dependent oxidoreductase
VINYRLTLAWGEAVREMTGGRGVDHVIEVGGPDTLEQSMLAARVGGHVALIGILTGTAGRLPVMTALAKHLRLRG